MKIKADYTNTPQWKTLNIKSTLPKQLECLNELAHNMWWAWNYEARNLFKSLDENLYEEVGEADGTGEESLRNVQGLHGRQA